MLVSGAVHHENIAPNCLLTLHFFRQVHNKAAKIPPNQASLMVPQQGIVRQVCHLENGFSPVDPTALLPSDHE